MHRGADHAAPQGRGTAPLRCGPRSVGWQLTTGVLWQRLDDEDYFGTARTLLGQGFAPTGSRCWNQPWTGERAGQPCGQPISCKAHRAFGCAFGGGTKARSRDVEVVLKRTRPECSFQTARRTCALLDIVGAGSNCQALGCAMRGSVDDPLRGPCGARGAAFCARREEALVDLEALRAGCRGC